MDPLYIFYDIHELITQHFSYHDIFRIFKVSKIWHSLVLENSKFAMRKIRLNINESNHDEVYSVLDQKISEMNSDILDILESKRKYQNIKVYVENGWDFIDQLVRNFSSSLVSIEVSSDIFVENLRIPNLKFLKLDNPLLDGLTTCSNKLKKLSVKMSGREYWLKKESPMAIKNALRKNSQLEVIELDEDLTSIIFETDISSEVSFKLKSLSIEFAKFNNDEEILGNARKFLERQQSLTNLVITYPDSATIQWIYENKTNLESLQIKIHFEQNPRDFQLSTNVAIKCLDLDISSNWQYTMNIKLALRTFITRTPNLELFNIRMTSPLEIDDFRFLLFNALKLKKLIQNADELLHTYQEIYEQIRDDHDNISPHVELFNNSY